MAGGFTTWPSLIWRLPASTYQWCMLLNERRRKKQRKLDPLTRDNPLLPLAALMWWLIVVLFRKVLNIDVTRSFRDTWKVCESLMVRIDVPLIQKDIWQEWTLNFSSNNRKPHQLEGYSRARSVLWVIETMARTSLACWNRKPFWGMWLAINWPKERHRQQNSIR